MDNSWQVKFGSTLQSSMPAMASSTSQEARDQMEINSGHCFYSHAGQDLRLQMHGRVLDPTFPSITNLGSSSSTHTDLSSSFLALLSTPASLLKFDFQDLSNPKLFNTSSKLASENGSMAPGCQLPLTSGRPSSENLNYQNLQTGGDLCPIVSSRVVACSNSGTSSVFQNVHPSANISLQGSGLAKAASHHTVLSNEKVKDFQSLRGERLITSVINGVKLQNAENQMLHKLPSEVKSSASNSSFIFSSGCPRVFCLDRSGDLLLSNTGLLGILCSCHCFHMSASRFCEHSGLWNVNPGDAIRMDSGETIAQWCKLNFQKFGIRIPEDQSGWDWPEGLSLTASLMKSGVSMFNMLKNSDCSNLVCPSGDLLRSGWPVGDVSPKNFLVNRNSVIDDLHDKRQKNCLDNNKFYYKGLVGTSQSYSCDVGDNCATDCSISMCSTLPKFAGRGLENICQSIFNNAIVKSGSLAPTYSALQNQRTLNKISDVNRGEDVQHFAIKDRVASSSSVELKLGQPYQNNHSAGNVVLPGIGPMYKRTVVDSQKPSSQEQIMHNRISCEAEEELERYLPRAVAIRGEQGHVNYTNCPIDNTLDADKIENPKGSMVKTSLVSQFKRCTLPEGTSQPRATSNLFHASEHVIPKTQHREYPAVKYDLTSAPAHGGNYLDRQRMIHESSVSKFADKGDGVGCLGVNSYAETASGSKLQKWMENTKSFTGVLDVNKFSDLPPMHEKSHCLQFSSNMPPDVSDAGNFSNCLDKVLVSGSSGHVNHVFLRSMGSSRDSKQHSASQGLPMCSPSSTSNPTLGPLAAMPYQDSRGTSPCFFDDNLRLLSLEQMLGLSRHQHVMSSLGKNLEQGKHSNSSNVKIKHSSVESLAVKEQRNAPKIKQDVSEISMGRKLDLFDPPNKMVNNVEKVTSMTGFSRWCNYSTLEQGMPLKRNESGMHCQLSQDLLYNGPSSLRFNGSQSTDRSNGRCSCCQKSIYFQCNCSCVDHNKCLGGNCNTRGGNHPNSLKEQMGSASCKTHVPMAFQFVKDFTVPEDNTISFDQLPKNVNYCGSHWKDVPSKAKIVHELALSKKSTDVLDERRHELFQLENSAAKYSNGAVQTVDSFEEQDTSNLSSGCSTLAASQASTEVANTDYLTIAVNSGYASNLIVDEGSGIDRCWSSDDAIESDKSYDFCDFACKSDLRRQKSYGVAGRKSARSLLDEVKLMDSLTWKKGQNQKHSGITVHEKSNQSQETEKSFKFGKRKRERKLKTLVSLSGTAVPSVHGKSSEYDGISDWHCSPKNAQLVPSGPESSQASGAQYLKIKSKHGNSKLNDTKTLVRKRDFYKSCDARDEEGDCEREINHDNSCKKLGISSRKKFRSNQNDATCAQFQMRESIQAACEKTIVYDSNNCHETSRQHMNLRGRKPKPVVWGKYGEIINRNMTEDVVEPVKILSLDKILKTAKKCSLPKSYERGQTSSKELKRTNFSGKNVYFDKSSSLTEEREIGSNVALACEEMNIHLSVKEMDIEFFSGDEQCFDDFSMVGEKKDHESGDDIIQDSTAHAHSRPKHRETRKRSLHELTFRGRNLGPKMASQKKIFNYAPKVHRGNTLTNSDKSCLHKSRKVKRCTREQKHLSVKDVDLFCCVCGMSNKDEVNCLLECGQCSIRVHQACYGVSKLPKGHWYCRPCKTNSKNIVCVLCGYGGGAMTRAFQSGSIVKSLLKAWNDEVEDRPKNAISSVEIMRNEQHMLHYFGSVTKDSSHPVPGPINSDPATSTTCNMATQNKFCILQNSSSPASDLRVHNSIIAGILDPTVKQWVHVVCGLWTPGTRCPNVDTMSAFDVSAASHPRENVVCSICNRRGGSCIKCRVPNCSVQFHPWCAHQKGLLQSEAEGVDNENVGFYGRCLLHATYLANGSSWYTTNNEAGNLGEKEASCARTEGYKGRKKDGFWHNIQSKGQGGCLVPQEQLNAWIHINGQRSSAHGVLKLPISEKEHDSRYTRYRQTKGWKHLVVYKSGIHALGLYTSRFISRGEMVVEYVGEIVGLRVADKRENEYQSGRRLQYKSACYFFRIDKEHVIDATCKGGIARFVNHSCLPNCVAKVISVRNEKKVVFFAERDIYPGEEITYDYHFNHEDEGKKIPCFCNAKNCRRYLN